MSLVEHLREFRNRLAVSLVFFVLATVAAYFFWQPIYQFLAAPYCDLKVSRDITGHCDLFVRQPLDAFLVRLRVSAIAGTVFSAPVWLYEVGAFITPGLHKRERRWAGGFLGAALVLFAAGVGMAYVTLSKGLQFLLNVGGAGVTPLLDISAYLGFVTLMFVAFGVAFEFPVVIVFANVVGLLSYERMKHWRRGMIVFNFVLAALITPSQDPFTFLAMAIPLCILYEVCIVVARVRARAERRRVLAAGLAGIPDDEASPLDARAEPLGELEDTTPT